MENHKNKPLLALRLACLALGVALLLNAVILRLFFSSIEPLPVEYIVTNDSSESLLIDETAVPQEIALTTEPQITTTPFRLHWDMPEWTLERRVDKIVLSQPWYDIPEPYQVTLTVYDDRGQVVQILTGLSQHQSYIGHEIGFMSLAQAGLENALVMHLYRWRDTGSGALAHGYFWVWDWQQFEFVLHTGLMDLEAMEITAEFDRLHIMQRDQTGRIYDFVHFNLVPYANFERSEAVWLVDERELQWVEKQTHLPTGTVTIRTNPRWQATVSIDWEVALLGSEFTQALVEVHRLQEYERVYRGKRAYELFWVQEIDTPWRDEGLILISEYIDGEWKYLQHINLGDALLEGIHTRYRISFQDLNFDGEPDLLVLTKNVGTEGRAYYQGFIWGADGYTELVGLLEIPNLHIDSENERFLGTARSGAARRFHFIYHLRDGRVVMTDMLERTFINLDHDVAFITTLRDGDWVDETLIVPDGEPWELFLDERWRGSVFDVR